MVLLVSLRINEQDEWYVTGIGTLERDSPTDGDIINNMTGTQFEAKVQAHEEKHVDLPKSWDGKETQPKDFFVI